MDKYPHGQRSLSATVEAHLLYGSCRPWAQNIAAAQSELRPLFAARSLRASRGTLKPHGARTRPARGQSNNRLMECANIKSSSGDRVLGPNESERFAPKRSKRKLVKAPIGHVFCVGAEGKREDRKCVMALPNTGRAFPAFTSGHLSASRKSKFGIFAQPSCWYSNRPRNLLRW